MNVCFEPSPVLVCVEHEQQLEQVGGSVSDGAAFSTSSFLLTNILSLSSPDLCCLDLSSVTCYLLEVISPPPVTRLLVQPGGCVMSCCHLVDTMRSCFTDAL